MEWWLAKHVMQKLVEWKVMIGKDWLEARKLLSMWEMVGFDIMLSFSNWWNIGFKLLLGGRSWWWILKHDHLRRLCRSAKIMLSNFHQQPIWNDDNGVGQVSIWTKSLKEEKFGLIHFALPPTRASMALQVHSDFFGNASFSTIFFLEFDPTRQHTTII